MVEIVLDFKFLCADCSTASQLLLRCNPNPFGIHPVILLVNELTTEENKRQIVYALIAEVVQNIENEKNDFACCYTFCRWLKQKF